MSKLDGKVAIITGSGRGIGRAIALKLSAEGASVIINDLDEAPAQEALAELQARGHAAHAVLGDVTATDFSDRLVAETLDKFGALDIVVNNAGYTGTRLSRITSMNSGSHARCSRDRAFDRPCAIGATA